MQRAYRLAASLDIPVVDLLMAYVLSQPFPTIAIVGATTPEHLLGNIEATEVQLTDHECRWLNLELSDADLPVREQ
jgi:aryl-alcohol dehydrogenase-like predicted oxidoreductase